MNSKNINNRKNAIDEEKLLKLIKSAKLTIEPQKYKMFIDDLNDVISFCDSINMDFDDIEDSAYTGDNEFLDLFYGNNLVNVYRADEVNNLRIKTNVWENSDRIDSEYVCLKRSNLQ